MRELDSTFTFTHSQLGSESVGRETWRCMRGSEKTCARLVLHRLKTEEYQEGRDPSGRDATHHTPTPNAFKRNMKRKVCLWLFSVG